jgi:hypothetical protein
MEAWQGDYARRSYGYSVFTQDIPPTQSGLALTICRKEDARWKICGIPEVLYTDNGSDFTSRDLEQVSADLKSDLYSQHQGSRAAEAASSASFIDRSDVSLRSSAKGYDPPVCGIRFAVDEATASGGLRGGHRPALVGYG